MATIPSGQKFHTLASFVETEEKGSALVNSGREIYTMQDIIDTVPAGAAVNPTSGFLPYNNGGVFADTPFSYNAFPSQSVFTSMNNPLSFPSTYASYGLTITQNKVALGYTSGLVSISPQYQFGLSINYDSFETYLSWGKQEGYGYFSQYMMQTTIGESGFYFGLNSSANPYGGPTLVADWNMVENIAGNNFLMVLIPGLGNKRILLQ